MIRSTITGLAGCFVLLVGCAKDSEPSAPEPAASQGSEATPEPHPALDPAAAPAEEPVAAIAPPPIPAPNTALSDAQLVGIVQAINAGEIEQAQLAKSKAKDARVKKFAEQMITHHTDSQKQLGKLENMPPAESSVQSDLKIASSADVDTLKNASAADFDAVYMTNQIKQHQAALDMLTNRLIPAASDSQLKTMLESTRATVEKHLQSANELQQALLNPSKAR